MYLKTVYVLVAFFVLKAEGHFFVCCYQHMNYSPLALLTFFSKKEIQFIIDCRLILSKMPTVNNSRAEEPQGGYLS